MKTGADAGSQQWSLPTHQRRSRQNRDRLLKAGERVFAAQGFADSHISQIVLRAGCSTGSFYRRFKDKEALFLALQNEMYDQAHINIDGFFSNPACDVAPLTLICFRLLENTAREAVKIKGYYRALFELSLRGIGVWQRMRDLERYQSEHLQRLFLRRTSIELREDFIPAVSSVIRMIAGNQVSLMLHGLGPYALNDFRLNVEYVRILMHVAGVPFEESEIEHLNPMATLTPHEVASPAASGIRASRERS